MLRYIELAYEFVVKRLCLNLLYYRYFFFSKNEIFHEILKPYSYNRSLKFHQLVVFVIKYMSLKGHNYKLKLLVIDIHIYTCERRGLSNKKRSITIQYTCYF